MSSSILRLDVLSSIGHNLTVDYIHAHWLEHGNVDEHSATYKRPKEMNMSPSAETRLAVSN